MTLKNDWVNGNQVAATDMNDIANTVNALIADKPRVYSTADYAAVSGDDRPRVLAAVNAAVAAMTSTGQDQVVLIHAPLTFTTGTTKAALVTTIDNLNASHSNVGVPLPVNLAHTLSIVYAPSASITLSSACMNVFYIDKLADYDVFQNVHFYNAWTNGGTSVANEAHALVGNSLGATPAYPLRYLSFQNIKFFGYTKFRGFNWDPAGGSGGQMGIVFRGEQNGPLEATQTFSKDIYLEYGDMEGGGGLFHVASAGSISYQPGGCNHYHDNIVVDRYRVVMPSTPTSYTNHVHTGIYIAGAGFGDRCYIGPGYVENIGDDAIEVGTMQQVDIVEPHSKNPWVVGVFLRQTHAPIDVESQQVNITGMRCAVTSALAVNTCPSPIAFRVDDQHITLSSTATSGSTTFTVPDFGTTVAVNWNASKATVAAAFGTICPGTTVTGAATLNAATPTTPMRVHVAGCNSGSPITFTSSLTGGALTLDLDPINNASFGRINIRDAMFKIDGLNYSKSRPVGMFIWGLNHPHRKIDIEGVSMVLSNYTFDGAGNRDINFMNPAAVFKGWGNVVMRGIEVVLDNCAFTTGGHTGFLSGVAVGGNGTRVDIDGFTEDRSGAAAAVIYTVTAGQTGNNTRLLLRRLTPKTLATGSSNNSGIGLFGDATVDRFDVYDCDFSQGTDSAARAIDLSSAGSNSVVVRTGRNIFPTYADQPVATDTHAATGKTTPVDADEFPLADSAASFGLKKLNWANLKTALATWLTTLAATWQNKTLTAPRIDTVKDTNGVTVLDFVATASAVNNLRIGNDTSGHPPAVFAQGADTDIDVRVIPKAAGQVQIYNTGSNTPAIRVFNDTADADLNLVPSGAGQVKSNGVPVVTTTGTQTETNKRITPRIGTVASSASPTINTDSVDQFNITALAAAISSMTTNLSGTPTDGQLLDIRLKDNGTARAITWGASFTGTLLATTVVSKTHLQRLKWDAAAAKWAGYEADASGY